MEERLHVRLSTILTDHSRHTGFSGMVRASVQAGSDDYELIANALYDTMPMTMDGIFTDLNSLDYIDFTKPWWNAPFMEMTNYYGKNYACIGELSQSMIAGTFVMFFHKDLFKLYYPDDPSLYETVLSGGWTLDKLISYCTPMYQDLNGDGKANEGDLYGHYFTKAHTLGTDSYLGGCNIRLMSQDGAGNYVYEGLSERTASFFEKMEKLLFESNNTAMFDYNNDEIMTTMKNNQTIFTAWMLSGIELLRDMKSDFGIIPMPKLDESQKDYHTFAHDGSSAFAIPTTEEDPNRPAARRAAETYRTVTPA
ncbi:MAG: hypothetical protein MJ175_04550 [Clostridia bacterium]|nr:hypothetical protein [Clostridia bacterium]